MIDIDPRILAERAGVGIAQVAIRGHPPGPTSEFMRYCRANIDRCGSPPAGGHIGESELPWSTFKGA